MAEVTTRGNATPGKAVGTTAGVEEMGSGKTDARATREATVAVEDTRVMVMAMDETRETTHTSRGLGGTTDLWHCPLKPCCI